MKEILPDIFGWAWLSPEKGYDFNGLFVRHESGNLVIDPVQMPDGVLEALAREGVMRILLTNRNHVRASMKVRERTGARIAIHASDAEHARSQGAEIEDELVVGQRAGPFVVVDASGKSPGEVALHWPERRLLVVGDVCIGKPPGKLGLLSPKVMDDPAKLRATLARIAADVDFDAILCGDGAHILQGAREAMRAVIALNA